MVEHLYVHIPFCHRICPYCAFYKHLPGKVPYDEFTGALIRELEGVADRFELQPRTIYFGGGTPSILPESQWRRIGEAFRGVIDLGKVEEWTIEANPRTFGPGKAEVWREIGISRVSLGAQSMDDEVLKTLGRDHSGTDVEEAFEALRDAGLANLNIDLMFAIPGQTLDSWEGTLEAVLSHEPAHLSTYNLTYEEDTEFLERLTAGEWEEDADWDAGFFAVTHRRLEEAGYGHYEVSNFARPGRESLHNRAYWQGRDYLGLGPGAVSTVERTRWKNLPDTSSWMERTLSGEETARERERLSETSWALERLALELRTREGVLKTSVSDADLAPLLLEGLVESGPERIWLTLSGMMVADEIAAYLA